MTDREISPGVYLSENCEICGKKRSRSNHDRCSKIKQKKYESQRKVNHALHASSSGREEEKNI